MVLDTLQLSKDLQPAFEPEQAEALSRALATVVAGGDHATKGDVAGLKTDVTAVKSDVAGLKTDVAALKGDVSVLRAEFKTEIAAVRVDVATQLAAFKVDVARWIVGAIAFNVLATAGLILTLFRTLAH